jgi:adenine-specific DNA-methyltransferase
MIDKFNEINGCKYIIGDCVDVMQSIPDEFFQMVVTSPPYNISKQYGTYNDGRNFANWLELIQAFGEEVYRLLKPNGSAFINVSQVGFGDGEVIPLDSFVYSKFVKIGFHLKTRIVWIKKQGMMAKNTLNPRHEMILWFVKDNKNFICNLDDVKTPSRGKTPPRYTDPNDKGEYLVNPTNVWLFESLCTQKRTMNINHPCPFPEGMVERCIKLSTNKGDTVLDPFLGSGTTLIAARKNNRQGYGIELGQNYEDLIIQRIRHETFNEII